MSNGAGKFALGVLLGGIVGAAAGVLMAPLTARETRRRMRRSLQHFPEAVEELTEEWSVAVQQHSDRLATSAQRTMADSLERLREAIAAGREASQRLHQELMTLEASRDRPSPEDCGRVNEP